MTRIITKAELSRWAQVSRMAVTKACRGPLRDATVARGVDVEHPLVREWLSTHGMQELPDGAIKSKPKRATKSAPAKTPPDDASQTVPVVLTEDGVYDMEKLEKLTIREVVMRYGSLDGFKRFVDILKSIAEYGYRELRAKQQRGQLIERGTVARVVFALIDVAYARLVTDVPDTVSKLVIARVESGGPGTAVDVQKIIRDANSRVLKSVKQSVTKLEILDES